MNKKEISAFILFLMITLPVLGQTIGEPVVVHKGLVTRFIQDDKVLNPKELLLVMSENEEAFNEMKVAQNKYVITVISAGAGGSILAYQLFLGAIGTETNEILTGIGAGLLIVAIPFNISYKKHAEKAVDIYNKNLESPLNPNIQAGIRIHANRIGLFLKF